MSNEQKKEIEKQHNYIKQEFRKIFKNSLIDIKYNSFIETIYVHVDGVEFLFDIGSDDEFYTFTARMDNVHCEINFKI